MSGSEVYVEPTPKIQRRLLRWVVESKQMIAELEKSGLVVNHGNRDDIPKEIRDRSSAIAAACIEITHGMLVLLATVAGVQLGDV
jgi:hypothetical protein